jgi:hypothetical protein
MKRHAFDVVSFLFALVFGALAAMYLAAPSLDWDVAGPWFFPVALIVLGVAAIIGAVSGLRPRRDAATDDDQVARVHDDAVNDEAALDDAEGRTSAPSQDAEPGFTSG